MGKSDEKLKQLRDDAVLIIVLFAPYYLNDIIYASQPSTSLWLATDYLTKGFSLVVILMVPRLRFYVGRSLRDMEWLSQGSFFRFLVVILLAAQGVILLTFIYYFVDRLLLVVIPDTHLFSYPRIDFKPLYWFDLSFGLALTAVAEEFTSRSVLKGIIERYSKNKLIIIGLSSLIFALAHWSLGIPSVISAFLAGMILMGLFLATGSIMPSIVAHYVINFIIFS